MKEMTSIYKDYFDYCSVKCIVETRVAQTFDSLCIQKPFFKHTKQPVCFHWHRLIGLTNTDELCLWIPAGRGPHGKDAV